MVSGYAHAYTGERSLLVDVHKHHHESGAGF